MHCSILPSIHYKVDPSSFTAMFLVLLVKEYLFLATLTKHLLPLLVP